MPLAGGLKQLGATDEVSSENYCRLIELVKEYGSYG